MAPINRMSYAVMPDVISLPRQVLSQGHQEDFKDWITAFAGMTSWAVINVVSGSYTFASMLFFG